MWEDSLKKWNGMIFHGFGEAKQQCTDSCSRSYPPGSLKALTPILRSWRTIGAGNSNKYSVLCV